MRSKYVKEQITTERKGKVDAERNSIKSQMEFYKSQMQSKIASLREELKGMSKEEKEEKREEIQSEISGLREENKGMREGLRAVFKQTSSTLKTEADEKYVAELDKIRSTSSFLKPIKPRKQKKVKKSYILK